MGRSDAENAELHNAELDTPEEIAGKRVMMMSVALLTALYKHDVPTVASVLEVVVADFLCAADIDPDHFIGRVKETAAFLRDQKAKASNG